MLITFGAGLKTGAYFQPYKHLTMNYYIIRTYTELMPTNEIGPDGTFIEKLVHKRALCDLDGTIIKEDIKTWIPDGLYRDQPSIQKIINS